MVHYSRIRPYADSLVSTPAVMRQVAERTDRMWFSVESLQDVRYINGVFEVLVSWKGLSNSGDTW